ncbi:MAG: PadR family transcriptional regulator [Armatimonadota bacterium]|nr:PadR family transcriptional regulator [Armatimonadota bacterium]
MPRGHCHRHGAEFGPCACSLGRVTRLVEPAVLFLLATGQATHGYDIVAQANELYLTDSVIDAAAVYRVLRDLEEQGCVRSHWQTNGPGPARRVYSVTRQGRKRLEDWMAVIARLAENMQQFVDRWRTASGETGGVSTR